MHYNLKQKLAFELTFFYGHVCKQNCAVFRDKWQISEFRIYIYIYIILIVLKTAIPKSKGGDSGEKQSN